LPTWIPSSEQLIGHHGAGAPYQVHGGRGDLLRTPIYAIPSALWNHHDARVLLRHMPGRRPSTPSVVQEQKVTLVVGNEDTTLLCPNQDMLLIAGSIQA
jgi:hypothetical protein